MPSVPTYTPITIPAGATGLSNEVNIGEKVLVGIIMPTAWTAAAITFAAADGRGGTQGVVKTFFPLQDESGTEVKITSPAASTFVTITRSNVMNGVSLLKLRSGTSGTPVDQTTSRVLTLVLRDES